jgi:hypothetical protein
MTEYTSAVRGKITRTSTDNNIALRCMLLIPLQYSMCSDKMLVGGMCIENFYPDFYLVPAETFHMKFK